MSRARLLAAWAVLVSALTASAGLGVYSIGILVRHGDNPSEVLYGWAAVRYLCPRIGGGLVAASALIVLLVGIVGGGRRRPAPVDPTDPPLKEKAK